MANNRINLPKKKKLLLKTHTQFDGSTSGPPAIRYPDDGSHHSQMVLPFSLQQATPNSLVIQALIQQVCIHMEQDGKKRKMLYTAVCKILNEHNFLGLDISLDELWPLKQKFCNVLFRFFRQVHKEVTAEGLGSCTSIAIRNVFDYVRTSDYIYHSNRYQQSFEELETIAKGGFGIVCKARNKIDGITYAVKKIKFMYTNDLEFKKVLREVRSFASLKHQNIVNYNNSWLETNLVTGRTVYKASSDSESFSSDGVQHFNNSSYETKSNEVCGVSPVSSCSSESLLNEGDSSEQSSNLSSQIVDSFIVAECVKSHSLVIDSAIRISQDNIVIGKRYQSNLLETLEQSSNHVSGVFSAEFSSQNEFSCCIHDKPPLPCQQVTEGTEHDTENENSASHFVCSQVDESGDHSQKPSSRRRRHSSGPTCSTTDRNSDVNNNSSRRRSYERGNSLDLDLRKCTELVPKKTPIKWDISNLDVMAVLYIQMELCDQSLRDWLDKRATIPFSHSNSDGDIKNALKMFQQIVQGVEHIHSKSIIHRDLKPKNIFVCKDGFIKIGDFGLAALCTQTDDEEFFHYTCSCSHTQGLGTAPYCAPEQRKGSNYDSKVDIYSLGIILIELLYQYQTRMEFSTTIDKILEGSIPIQFVAVWPKEVVNLIQRLISRNPKKRPEAKEVLCDLKRCKVTESLAVGDDNSIVKNEEISRLQAQVCALEKRLLEKDEIIKELQLKLLYSTKCDSFI